MKINDFVVGDKIRITFTLKNRADVGDAEVTAINYKGNGLVTFYGVNTGSGAFDPNKVGAKPFGITNVEMVKPAGRYKGSEPYGV